MKKILIVGAGELQVPMIQKAKETGLEVAVVDFNPNAPGIQYADKYFNCSTIDKNGLLKIAEEYKPNGITTMATDMPMRTISYVCEKIGLPCISQDTALLATDKYEMIKQFEKFGVDHPKFKECDNFVELNQHAKNFNFPFIIKPVDNSGSRGVVLVKNENELNDALEYSKHSSRNGKVLIEEYMDGPEVSVECFAIDGNVNVLQITDKITTGSPHFVELGHTQPSSLSKIIQQEIVELASKAVLSLGIKNGPAHVEIIVTKTGPKMVELGARMGGDCITSHLVPLSTGIDMIKCTILSALGEKGIELSKKWNKGSAIRFFNFNPGVVEEVINEYDNKCASAKEFQLHIKPNDIIENISSSCSRKGYVISQSDTNEEAGKICEAIISKVKIKYKER